MNDEPQKTLVERMFHQGRSHQAWQDREVDESLLREAYDLMKMGPTSANCCPLRIAFVRDAAARARLLPCLSPGNVEKTRKAPVTAVFAYDVRFYAFMPTLFPHADFHSGYAANPKRAEASGTFNATLQIGYFILAARGRGLDCGPMAGFERTQVDAAFFPDGRWKSLLLCNLGFGDARALRPRGPRLAFADACRIL